MEPVANSRLYGRDFNHMGTRTRPEAGTHRWQLSGNRKICNAVVPESCLSVDHDRSILPTLVAAKSETGLQRLQSYRFAIFLP